MKNTSTTILLVAFLAISPFLSLQASVNTAPNHWATQLRHTVQYRFQHLDFPFQAQYSKKVERIILDYLGPGRLETEKMLGRTSLYFPIFEYYLDAYDLPEELKYIPFIESRLLPKAQSSAGASGLWQFMPATARGYGLKSTDHLDERLDPHRSTQAAVEMLSELYQDFGDWSLALAAYNCGPGRVKKAIKKTGCHNFWDIKAFLPKQTQKYIPAFLAALYVARYHQSHDLYPKSPKHLPIDNYSMKLHQRISFKEIAATTNLSLEVIRKLNPGYIKEVVPASETGHFIVLPAKAICALKNDKSYSSPFSISGLACNNSKPVEDRGLNPVQFSSLDFSFKLKNLL